MPNVNLLPPLPFILLGQANTWTEVQTFPFGTLRDLLIFKGFLGTVPTVSGWTDGSGVGGSVTGTPTRLRLEITTAASAQALARVAQFMGLGRTAGNNIDWDRELIIAFHLNRVVADANNVLTGYFQSKAATTHGILAAKGVGLVLGGTNGLAVTGETYGTARSTVSLGTITAGADNRWVIHHNPATFCRFYLNGALVDSITTAANLPSGTVAAPLWVLSLDGGAGASATCYFDLSPILYLQV